MLAIIYVAEKSGQLLAWAALAQIWVLPFLIWLRVVDITQEKPWLVWAMLTILIAKPLGTGLIPHPPRCFRMGLAVFYRPSPPSLLQRLTRAMQLILSKLAW